VARNDDDLPVLNEVVRTGNESIIQSTRLAYDPTTIFDSSSSTSLHFDLPAHLQFENLDDASTAIDLDDTLELDEISAASMAGKAYANEEITTASDDDELELLIDDIIDRHIVALRRDIRALLERTRKLP
jgi:hypothetical protein